MIKIENKKTNVPNGTNGETADYKFLIEVLLDSKPLSGFTRKEFKLVRRIEQELDSNKYNGSNTEGQYFEFHHEEIMLLQRINDEMRWRDADKEIEEFTDVIAEAK